ncbi:MAG TPA: TolC family protein [Myxococcota bacterium]|nr:TolC family protein [Myxococcota bacterium]
MPVRLRVASTPTPWVRAHAGCFCALLVSQLGCAVIGVAVSASAQTGGETLPEQVTLGWAIARALEHNPELQAANARLRSMQERPSQAGALPDPSVALRYHNEDWDTTFGRSEFTFFEVGVEQELPFPGKRSVRRRIAEREALRERAMRDMTALMVLARVGMQYADLVALERSDLALTESLAALETLIAQAAARYGVGEAEQQDVLRTGLERDMIRERLAMVTRARAKSGAQLAALLGVERVEDLPAIGQFEGARAPRSLEELRARAEDQSPALRAASEEWLRAEEALRLARREYFPDFALMAAYMDKKQLLPEWEIGLRFSVPLYLGRKQRRAVAEAAFAERAAERERRRAQLDVGARLAELHAAAESSNRLLALYRESLIPSASLTFESARASYATGRVDLLTTLSAFVALLDYRIREAEETASLLAALSEIGPLVGETPLGEPLGDAP